MMDSNKNECFRTIFTNVVLGSGHHTYHTTMHMIVNKNEAPSGVLGCIITNAEIVDTKFENSNRKIINVRVDGKFEVHVWYLSNGDTKISKNIAKFSKVIEVENIEEISFDKESDHRSSIIAKINKGPAVLGTSLVNQSGVPTIAIQVEYELEIEVTGEVRLKVLTYLNNSQNEEDEILIPETIYLEEYGEDDD